MDPTGKVIWAKHMEIWSSSLKGVASIICSAFILTVAADATVDGERLPIANKELGNVEVSYFGVTSIT